MNPLKLFNKYRENIKSDPEKYYKDYLKIKEKVKKSSAEYNGKPVEFLYQPMFLSRTDLDKFENLCNKLTVILKKVIQEYLNNPDFRSYFRFPAVMEDLILQNPGYDIEFPMARVDIFYPFNVEEIKFCEFNADGSSGMNEARVLQELFTNSKALSDFKDDYHISTFELFDSWIDVIIKNYNEFIKNKEDKFPEKPNIAIVDFKGEGVESEFGEFKKYFMERNYEVVICDPRKLNYIDGKLYCGDFKIDLIYRRVTTGRLVEKTEEVQDFIQAYKDGAVCVVGGFVSQLIHNKILFALLHDEDKTKFLNPAERNFVKKHIPYTFILKDNDKVYNEALNNKDKYILKPFDWFASHGVYVGRDYEQQEWETILQDIKGKDYILQEFCNVPSLKMLTIDDEDLYFEDYNYMLGLYMYNQTFKGIYTRVSRENIIGSIVECFTLPNFLFQEKGGNNE